MSYTKMEVCNAALQRIGTENLISSLDDGSAEAQVLNLHYDMTLGAILRSFPWRFARRTAELVESAEDAHPLWNYVYSTPAKCVKVLRLFSEVPRPGTAPEEFDLQSYASGYLVYTDLEDAYLEYTYLVEDPSLWDYSFLEAFTLRLASVICLPLTGSDSKTKALSDMAQYAWQNAIAMSASESKNPNETATTRSRYKNARTGTATSRWSGSNVGEA